MKTLTSKEYAAKLRMTTDQVEMQKAFEANLIEMGKRSAYEIEEGYKQGKLLAVKEFMSTYKTVKEYYSEKGLEGLTFDVIDVMLAEAAENIMEEL